MPCQLESRPHRCDTSECGLTLPRGPDRSLPHGFNFDQGSSCSRNGNCDHRPFLKRFRYALDPLCFGAVALYAINRWIFDFEALSGWFADILLIPAAAPAFLWIERQIGLRTHDNFPSIREIVFLTAAWSVAAEGIAPMLFVHCTADPLDIVYYATGAAISAAWWRWRVRKSSRGCF
jgi:hypothetical protein